MFNFKNNKKKIKRSLWKVLRKKSQDTNVMSNAGKCDGKMSRGNIINNM